MRLVLKAGKTSQTTELLFKRAKLYFVPPSVLLHRTHPGEFMNYNVSYMCACVYESERGGRETEEGRWIERQTGRVEKKIWEGRVKAEGGQGDTEGEGERQEEERKGKEVKMREGRKNIERR